MHAPLDALLDSPKPAILTEEKIDKSNGIHEPATFKDENVEEASGFFGSLEKNEKIFVNGRKESSTTEAEVTDMLKGLTKKKKKLKKAGNEIIAGPVSAEDPLPSSSTEEKQGAVTDMFEGPAKKKKKPKKAGNEIPAEPASADNPLSSSTIEEKEGEVTGMSEGLAKKKKKSKNASNEIHAEPASVEDSLTSSATEERDEEDLSTDLTKKKSKKSTKVGGGSSAETAKPFSADSPIIDAPAPTVITEEQVGEVTDMFKGLAKKKKPKKTDKKTKPTEPTETEAEAGAGEEEGGDPNEGTGIWNHNAEKDLNYGQLLDRFYQILQDKNPDMMSGKVKSYKIPPPQCVREGNKKTIFANIAEICNRMERSDDHVTSYLFAELGTNGSVDASRRLVIKGRFQQKQIENVLRRYISTFQLPFSHPPFQIFPQNNSDCLYYFN